MDRRGEPASRRPVSHDRVNVACPLADRNPLDIGTIMALAGMRRALLMLVGGALTDLTGQADDQFQAGKYAPYRSTGCVESI